MDAIRTAFDHVYRAVFNRGVVDLPADEAQLLREFEGSVQTAKRRVTEEASEEEQISSLQPPRKRQRKQLRTHDPALEQRIETLSIPARTRPEADRYRQEITNDTSERDVPGSAVGPSAESQVSRPARRPADRGLRILPVEDDGVTRKALVLDETLVSLLSAAIEAQRERAGRNHRAGMNIAILEEFRHYAIDECSQLERGQKVFARPPYDEFWVNHVRQARRELEEKLQEASIEAESLIRRDEDAKSIARHRNLDVMIPMEKAFLKEGLLANEEDFSQMNTTFERRFAIPGPSKRYTIPDIGSNGRYNTDDTQYGVRGGRMDGDERSRGPRSGLAGSNRGPRNRDPPEVAAQAELGLRRKERDEAQYRFDIRRRETGAQYNLRHNRTDDTLAFDLLQFQNNNALTRSLVEAERRLVEAKAAARVLNVDTSSPSQLSGFNDPDGDADPATALSGVDHKATGVRTTAIDQWLAKVPDEGFQDPQRAFIRVNVDEWDLSSIGSNQSPSVVAEGRRKEKIQGERRAAIQRQEAAEVHWRPYCPRYRREDRWNYHHSKKQ